MARITEIRLTLAAFIYAIEIDIKNVVKKYVTPYQENTSFFQDTELEVDNSLAIVPPISVMLSQAFR